MRYNQWLTTHSKIYTLTFEKKMVPILHTTTDFQNLYTWKNCRPKIKNKQKRKKHRCSNMQMSLLYGDLCYFCHARVLPAWLIWHLLKVLMLKSQEGVEFWAGSTVHSRQTTCTHWRSPPSVSFLLRVNTLSLGRHRHTNTPGGAIELGRD